MVVVNVAAGVIVDSGVGEPGGGVAVTITVITTGETVAAGVGLAVVPQPTAVTAPISERKLSRGKIFFMIYSG